MGFSTAQSNVPSNIYLFVIGFTGVYMLHGMVKKKGADTMDALES